MFPICVAAVPSCIRTGAKLQGTMQLDKVQMHCTALPAEQWWRKVLASSSSSNNNQQSAVGHSAFSSHQWIIQHSAVGHSAVVHSAMGHSANRAFISGALNSQQWGIQPSVSQQWGIEASAFSSGVVVHSALVHEVVAFSSGAFSSGAFSTGAFSIQQRGVQLSAFSSGALSPHHSAVEHSTFNIQHSALKQIRLGTCRAPLKHVVV